MFRSRAVTETRAFGRQVGKGLLTEVGYRFRVPPTAKQTLLAALEDALVARPSFALVYRLAGSAAAAEAAMADIRRRRRLAAPVRRYVNGLSEAQARRVMDAARQTPSAVHPLHGQMGGRELLAVAVIALATGRSALSDFSPLVSVPPEY